MNFKKLSGLCLLLLTVCLPLARTEQAGHYTDKDGNPLAAPKTAYSLENPGTRKKEAADHDPVITSRRLKQGLETTWVFKAALPQHPLPKTKKRDTEFPIKAIYLVDKDGIVVGYQEFTIDDAEASYETKINGIINYLEVYVECREHGTWLKKVRLT